jgi:hypothetical protein
MRFPASEPVVPAVPVVVQQRVIQHIESFWDEPPRYSGDLYSGVTIEKLASDVDMPQLMDKGHYGITVQNQANRSKGGAALLGLTDTDARRISQYLVNLLPYVEMLQDQQSSLQ